MYIVVENKNVSGVDGIVDEVNSHLDKGFVPIGGLMFNNGYYYQTMFCFDEVAVAPLPVEEPIIPPNWRDVKILRMQNDPEFMLDTNVKYEFRGEKYTFSTREHVEFNMATQMLCLSDWASRP